MAARKLRAEAARGARFSQEAIDAWRRGDVRALHEELNLAPFEFCPLPRRYADSGGKRRRMAA